MRRSIAFFLTICFCLMAFQSADACRRSSNDCCCEPAPRCCKAATSCCQPRRVCAPRINRCCRQVTCCDARVNCNAAVHCGPVAGAVVTGPVYSGDAVPMAPSGSEEVMESSNIVDGSSDVIIEESAPATESVPVDAPAETVIPDAPVEG